MNDNQCHWDGDPGHYEVWYLTGNHRASHTGYWIRYTLEAPLPGHGAPYAQIWFAYFDALEPTRNFAINRKLPIDALLTESSPFRVKIADNELHQDRAHGQLSGAGHDAAWELSWRPAAKSHRHLPAIMYRRGGLGETTVLSPNLDIAVSGRITADGHSYELQGEPFGQTHLWGRKHAHTWAWGHCNGFADRPGAALEILSVILRRRGLTLPRMTVFTLYLDGRAHRFNEFHHTLFTSAEFVDTPGERRFAFQGRSARWRVQGEYRARLEDMVVAEYVDPDGAPSFCANTEVADLHVTVYERHGLTGWREYTRLLAQHAGHFELGSRARDPRIPAEHLMID